MSRKILAILELISGILYAICSILNFSGKHLVYGLIYLICAIIMVSLSIHVWFSE